MIVTGALGFVASFLIPRLIERGARIIAIVRPMRDASRLEAMGVEVRRADLDAPAEPALFSGAAAIVHLSGLAQVPGFVGTLASAGIRRGVFVGSTGVYTRLASAGAEAKRAGEASLRDSAIDYTILRPTMIYGTPEDRNLARLLRWLERWPLVAVPGGGTTLQQPVHVEDLVAAILAALERPLAARREYDCGGPEALPLAELIRDCARALSRPVWLVPVPLGASFRLVTLLRRLGLPGPVRGEQVLRLAESKAVDIGPARKDLGYAPRPFSEGIRSEVALLRGRRASSGRAALL